jgi:predicted DNA-binding transcriptional regulator YafY
MRPGYARWPLPSPRHLLSALLLLQAYGRLPGRELAERLEVSPRTVHRDMEVLSAAGVPVFAMRGSRGGWQLDEQWRAKVPGLDEVELRALLLAQPRVMGDARLESSAERAITKLMTALPAALRARVVSMRERLFVDPFGWRGTVVDLPALPIVQEALSLDRVLSFGYRSPGRERTIRTAHPLGLVSKGTAWYLVADTAAGRRTFRVSRMDTVVMLETTFERPSTFDLESSWRASTETYRRDRRCVVTLRLDTRAAADVRTWCLVRPDATEPVPDAEGRVTLRVEFGDQDEARFIVLGLGAGAEVLEPASLRESIAAEISVLACRAR